MSDKKNPHILSIFYNNPDVYPPIINSTQLLVEDGFKVDITCRVYGETWGIVYPALSKILRIPAKGKHTWQQYVNFLIAVWRRRSDNIDLYIGHDMHGLLPAWMLSRKYKKPLVYHCHDFAEDSRKLPAGSHLVRLIERRIAKRADIVIVPDAERAKVVEQQLDLKTQPIVVANTPLEAPSVIDGKLHKELRHYTTDYEKIVFRQGAIGYGHALEMTIRSMVYWESKKWLFVIMGPVEQSYKQHLTELAEQLNVESRFFILPPVPYSEVARFTAEADVGHALYDPIHINNLHITTASNKIMEYMAAGCPLLLSDRPDLRLFIEKTQCGIVADEKSPTSIAYAINRLMKDEPMASQMGQAGKRAYIEEYNYFAQFSPVLQKLKHLVVL